MTRCSGRNDEQRRLSKWDSKQKLSSFFIDIAKRMNSRQRSSRYELVLSMRRSDIANYLGMAIETVSRWVTRFHQDGLIDVSNRHVTISDIDMLCQLLE